MVTILLWTVGVGTFVILFNYLLFGKLFPTNKILKMGQMLRAVLALGSFLFELFLIGQIRQYLINQSVIQNDGLTDAIYLVSNVLLFAGSYFWFLFPVIKANLSKLKESGKNRKS